MGKVLDRVLIPINVNFIASTDVLLGINPENPDILPNQIIVLAKQYILNSKYKETELSIQQFQNNIKELYHIVQKLENNKVDLAYNKKWENILHLL